MYIPIPSRFRLPERKGQTEENEKSRHRTSDQPDNPRRPIIRFAAGDCFVRFAGLSEAELKTVAGRTDIKRMGNGISGRVYFSVITDEPLSREDAGKVQAMTGYHPAGYGFFSLNSEKTDNGQYNNRWTCAASCD